MKDISNGMSLDSIQDQIDNSKYLFWVIPAYPVFLGIGIFAVIIASIIKFKIKKIPLRELQIGIYIVVPLGILGGSLFGKLLSYESINWKIWEYFFFWEPGMNLYGALLFGGVAGFLYFNKVKKDRRISILVYADCIVPHILLGQAIGRWGNLFNHEILGKEMADPNKFKWLPDFIYNRLFYIMDPSTGIRYESVTLREPLFLYESIGTFLMWILVIFVLSNLGRIFSKKPWNFETNAYPNIFNKKLRFISEENLVSWNTQSEIKYKKLKNKKLTMSLYGVWNKAYYLREVNLADSNLIAQTMENNRIFRLNRITKYKKTKQKLKKDLELQKDKFLKKRVSIEEYKKNVTDLKQSYKNDIKTIKGYDNFIANYFARDSKELYKLHNPYNYFVIHCGVLSSAWIVCYTLLRMILEHQRNVGELMIKWSVTWDYVVLSSILVFGITLGVFAQFVAPKKWREEEWLYEKSY